MGGTVGCARAKRVGLAWAVTVLALTEAGAQSLRFRPLDAASVLYSGDAAEQVLEWSNPTSAAIPSVLELQVTDFGGRTVDRVEEPCELDPEGRGVLRRVLRYDGPGYYRVRATLSTIGHAAAVAETSFAVLDRPREFPDTSPFGFYFLGNERFNHEGRAEGALRYLQMAGARWATSDIWWDDIQNAGPDAFDWDVSDHRLGDMKAYGFQPIIHLYGTPKWASRWKEGDPVGGDGLSFQTYPPRDYDDWARFVRAFVARYKDQLAYLRIWNEPNIRYWMGTVDDFGQLLKTGTEAARSVRPDIRIVLDVTGRDLSLFDKLVASGYGPYWDVTTVHNYILDRPEPPELTRMPEAYRQLAAWRDAHKPGTEVWDSEFCCLAEPWPGTRRVGHGEDLQAAYGARQFILGLAAGMERMIWFPGIPWVWQTDRGMADHSGSLLRLDLTPRPIYVAFHTLASLLSEAQFDEALSESPDSFYAYRFRSPEGYVTVVWSAAPRTGCTVAPSRHGNESGVRLIDLMGKVADVVPEALVLGSYPVFLVSDEPVGLKSVPPAADSDERDVAVNSLGMRFVSVTGGRFTLGSDQGLADEGPTHPVEVAPFYCGQYEVTAAQLCAFLNEAPPETAQLYSPGGFTTVILENERYRPRPGCENYPANGVSWLLANRFCRWLSEKEGRTYRLPTEIEWEYAARGADGRTYPWGEDDYVSRCNAGRSWRGVEETLEPVDAYPRGASPCGALGMAGGVDEWCLSLYRPYPYDPVDGREDLDSDRRRVLRGGSWLDGACLTRTTARKSDFPDTRNANNGFRVICEEHPAAE